MALCEVRITTHKRPDLLRRCLNSLIGQTYSDWKALILDDSLQQEGRAVVEETNDPRIIYQPNPVNLGRTKNLDAAFQSTSMIGGQYAFVLEDDNYLYDSFIADNIRSLEENQVAIVLRNQDMRLETETSSISLAQTTRGRWFSQGWYSPFEVYARLFFCEGISNGGLFWATDRIQSNLQVGEQIADSWHQEIFRTLQIRDVIFFEPTPLAVWTEFERVQRARKQSLRSWFAGAAAYNRATQSILIHLLQKHGDTIVQTALKIAGDREEEQVTLEHQLLNICYTNYSFKHIGRMNQWALLVKNRLRHRLFEHEFAQVLSSF
jgi:GT2 family glycosyltransferase